jgi:NAD(P)-dependent dehydrogenase (short-subunit alcohol dehydrogenase family)
MDAAYSLIERVIVVTGGAGGIGSAIARRFADSGARVVIANRSEARGRAVATSLPGKGHLAVGVQVDDS